MEQVFRDAGEQLEKLVLGDNESLDEVRSGLNLVTAIQDTGISVSWEIDNHAAMNQQGELKTENLTDEGTLVKLTAVLSYKEETAENTFFARLYPPKLNQTDKLLKKLDAEMERLDEETKDEKYLTLSTEVDGIPVIWKYGTDFGRIEKASSSSNFFCGGTFFGNGTGFGQTYGGRRTHSGKSYLSSSRYGFDFSAR